MGDLKVGTQVYINIKGQAISGVVSKCYPQPVRFCTVKVYSTYSDKEIVVSKNKVLVNNKNRRFSYEI